MDQEIDAQKQSAVPKVKFIDDSDTHQPLVTNINEQDKPNYDQFDSPHKKALGYALKGSFKKASDFYKNRSQKHKILLFIQIYNSFSSYKLNYR